MDWFEIQPLLESVSADVLFIFDCCHASQAAKARKKGTLELLAASSAGGKTPGPGKYSFTRYVVDELREAVLEKGSLQVSELHAKVNRRTMETTKITPVHFTLRPDPLPSIILRPIVQSKSPLSPLGSFTFTISVSEAPSHQTVRQLAEWIKRTAPNTISAVKIDRILDLSQSLHEFLLDKDRAGVKGRFIDSVKSNQKNMLLQDMHELGHTIVEAQVSNTSSTVTGLNSEANTANSIDVGRASSAGAAIFQKLEKVVQKLFESVWIAASSHSAFHGQEKLQKLKANELAQHVGLSANASLSLLSGRDTGTFVLQPPIPFREFTPKRTLRDKDRYLSATIRNRSYFLEIIRYSPAQDGSAPKSILQQFPKTASFLSTSKPEYFRTLPCIGYVQDVDAHWFGLAFEIPEGRPSFSTLEQLLSKSPRVPLEIRYRLAFSIALSLYGLHSVDWIYKGIRSENILFFHNSKIGNAELDQPWLFGYEYTKEASVDSSKQPEFRMKRLVYLPPSRWGVPTAKFLAKHDIYALVGNAYFVIHSLRYADKIDRAFYFLK